MGSAHRPKQYFVYILASRSRVLHTGVTNDLVRRVAEHKLRTRAGFTSRYDVHCLVYVESTSSIKSAIAREKQIKGWSRAKKVALVESLNPSWEDLSIRIREAER